uniref:Uncharacterized protein n=1 Tax=Fundulus heteroclitus TaxID=8078 RepID=A0A3Q2PQI1_FUNHE
MSLQMETTMQRLQERFLAIRMRISLTCTPDQMGTRIDELEKNVTELMTQAGMEDQSSKQ